MFSPSWSPSISRMAINVDCTFQFLSVQWVVIAIIALKFGEVQRSQVRWILDIAEDNMLMMVFLAISKYRIQSARKVFAVVNAFTDLGSRYSSSRCNAGESIARNGSRRSAWYSTSNFRAMSTRKGLKI